MRALVIGPPGTPYEAPHLASNPHPHPHPHPHPPPHPNPHPRPHPHQDAVFVFDLQLPADFPQQPPAVHYISHGERINPNLYENGKVGLRLLRTLGLGLGWG